MKRSEAIELIKNNIGTIDTDTDAQANLDLEKSAQNILRALLDAGLMPPELGGCPGCSQCNGEITYGWDEE